MADRLTLAVTVGVEASCVIASELGESTAGLTCTAALRRLPGGRNSYLPLPATAYTATVTAFAGDATRGPGFTVTIADDAALSPGVYQANAYIVQAGNTIETLEWIVEVTA